MTEPRKEPAERDAFLKLYYRDWRATLLGRFHNRLWAWAAAPGLTADIVTTLVVK